MLNSFSLSKPGNKLPSGTTEIPFVFKLQGSGAKMLYETYHGVFINIQYFLKVEMKRGLLAKDVEKSCEFIVEYSVSNLNIIRRCGAIIHKPLFIIFYYMYVFKPKDGEKACPKPVDFVIAPETVHKLKSKYTVPNFKITGKLNSLICSISNPFTGEVCICSTNLTFIRVDLSY